MLSPLEEALKTHLKGLHKPDDKEDTKKINAVKDVCSKCEELSMDCQCYNEEV